MPPEAKAQGDKYVGAGSEYGGYTGFSDAKNKRSRINADKMNVKDKYSRATADIIVHEAVHGYITRAMEYSIFLKALMNTELTSDGHIENSNNLMKSKPSYNVWMENENKHPELYPSEKLTKVTSGVISIWIESELDDNYFLKYRYSPSSATKISIIEH